MLKVARALLLSAFCVMAGLLLMLLMSSFALWVNPLDLVQQAPTTTWWVMILLVGVFYFLFYYIEKEL
jgi:sterol desaturase/sphingolipid hydroxylase (fatty acid hydroxylase superfamily)